MRSGAMSAELVSALPPAQRLALAYCPARARPATLALLALDARLAGALQTRREPFASQLRLAWWRDRFAGAQAEWPAGEPVLEALRSWREPRGLAALVDGWEALLAERLSPEAIAEFLNGRARAFGSLASELGAGPPEPAERAARIWAAADLAANLSDRAERELAVEQGRELLPPPRLAASLRPLAVLAALGAVALAKGGAPLLCGPRSALTALRTGLTGR